MDEKLNINQNLNSAPYVQQNIPQNYYQQNMPNSANFQQQPVIQPQNQPQPPQPPQPMYPPMDQQAQPANFNMQYPVQQPYNNMMPVKEKGVSSPMAILSLVCGIVSFISFWFWYVAVPFAMGGVALGLVANTKGRKNSGVAITGIVLSAIGFASAIVKLLAMYSTDF